jgi:hypothetical protein
MSNSGWLKKTLDEANRSLKETPDYLRREIYRKEGSQKSNVAKLKYTTAKQK